MTTTVNLYSKEQTDTLLGAKANSSSLATVATTGSYSDLTNQPTIPSGTQLVPSGGTDGQVLKKVSGTPTWANESGGGSTVTLTPNQAQDPTYYILSIS